MRYRVFGRRTGLRVSEFALGTAGFRIEPGYRATPAEAKRIFDAYAALGGNFIDTSDNYQFGQSEQVVGDLIGGDRDNFVLATKYTQDASRNPGISKTGNSRKNMI